MSGVFVLAGMTASGKTRAALALAERFDAEIVGADSRQIYRDMPIGTAAPTSSELARVPHHLVAFLDPRERYSAARFARDATRAVRAIHARGKRAIVVGGTGFYIRALTGGVALAPEHDAALRVRLAHEAALHPAPVLWEWLRVRDPRRAAALDPGDTYRVLRALEIALAPSNARAGDAAGAENLVTAGMAFFKVALDVPMERIDAAIASRARAMLERGLIEEAERIGAEAVAASAVGYPQALAYARGWSTRAELEASLARATRRYARRQRSWFRAEPLIEWLPPGALERAAREKLGWT